MAVLLFCDLSGTWNQSPPQESNFSCVSSENQCLDEGLGAKVLRI